MKLPSYLAKSRHGVFYYRITVRRGAAIQEKRWSLNTRSPAEAKLKALYISAAIKGVTMSSGDGRQKFDVFDQRTWPSDAELEIDAAKGDAVAQALLEIKRKRLADGIVETGFDLSEMSDRLRALQISIGNVTLTADPNNPADLKAARDMALSMMASDGGGQRIAGPAFEDKSAIDAASPVSSTPRNLSGLTLDELISRYATRKRDANAAKTSYEYEKMQRKFERWLHAKKKVAPYPVRLINRTDISDFIDDLMEDGVSAQTVQKKYLSALNGLFTLAQSSGAIPAGELPTRNHKLFTKADQKKAKHRAGYKLFPDEELSLIFDPEKLLELEKPCDFWLPLLGLFTGGRISELCQLKVSDIKQIDGIWALDINDEDAAQTLKTPAALRTIPLPPQLIQIGFLEYLDMVRPYDGTIFPYMDPDAFNHYGKTPGRRFGEYLDRLKITSRQKVFHSLRSTSNNRLKQLGVNEETRCQFIGHEHDTVNSKVYSASHSVRFLFENISEKLNYPQLKLDKLRFPAKKQADRLAKEMRDATKRRNARAAREARAKRNGGG
uniref:site-specific integrase n=1 Tax=Hylemonella sp. TaxID=2066020 RepID=UPI0035B4B9CC